MRCFALDGKVVSQLYKIRVRITSSVTIYQKLHFFYLVHSELTIIDAVRRASSRFRSSGLGAVQFSGSGDYAFVHERYNMLIFSNANLQHTETISMSYPNSGVHQGHLIFRSRQDGISGVQQMDLRCRVGTSPDALASMEDYSKLLLRQRSSTSGNSARMTIIDGYYTSYIGVSECALFVGAWDGSLRVLSFIVL